LFEGPITSGAVALTFDDGPHERHTRELLEVLARWGVPGSFFWLGELLEGAGGAAAAREVISAGHHVGIHGDVHRSIMMRRQAAVREGLERVRMRIAELGGMRAGMIRDYRPPFGHVTRRWAGRLERWGYRVVLCSILPGDWNTGPDEVQARVMRRVRAGSIVALHEGAGNGRNGAKIVAGLIPRILDRGLGFTTVGCW
jgi:peptidoglycan/xylan/chitin deacetylase (PgdA/CDA1 family)